MSELPEKLRPFEDLFRPEEYVLPTTAKSGDTLLLEQALPPESWTARARRLGQHAMTKIVRSPRTRSYGLGFGLGGAAVATGIAVALFSPNNNTDAVQPPETPQKLTTPTTSATPNIHTTQPDKMMPIAKPSDIPPSLWPSPNMQTWESTPIAQPSASSAPKTIQPRKPAPLWSTMLPTVSQSPTNTESSTAPPTDGPTPSPETTGTPSIDASPETPPTVLSPSPDG